MTPGLDWWLRETSRGESADSMYLGPLDYPGRQRCGCRRSFAEQEGVTRADFGLSLAGVTE